MLVPVLRRPHRVAPFLESLRATECRVLFICDPDDVTERKTVREAGEEELVVRGNYARKIWSGVAATDEPLILTGADDIEFMPGWFHAAKRCIDAGAHVVGVNDLIERDREHTTHFLMTREYAVRPTIDGGAGPFHHGYSHWFCDDELIATAKKRGVYAYAADSHVQHLHPIHSHDVPDDATYRKGRTGRRRDRHTFQQREALWQ